MSIGQEIFKAGEDAFKSMFWIEFPEAEIFLKEEDRMRVTNFNFPSEEIHKYEIWSPFGQIYRASRTLLNEKHSTFSFRVDQNWETYKALLEKKKYFLDYLNWDGSGSKWRFKIIIYFVRDTDINKFTCKWIFNNCFIFSLSEIDFSYSTSEPIELSVGFCFDSMEMVEKK